MKRPTLSERLARSTLFAAAGQAQLERLARAGVRRELSTGEVLWRSAERPDALALVLSGRLEVVRTTARGRRLVLRSVGPDALVGVSMVAGEPCTATIAAGEESTLLLVPGAAIRALFAEDPTVALRAIAQLADLVGRLSDEREAQRDGSLEERVAACLATLGAGLREVRLTHQDLADRVGATRPNVTRALGRLEQRGAIRRRRGRIEILG